jgi:hypothetical protein
MEEAVRQRAQPIRAVGRGSADDTTCAGALAEGILKLLV